MTKTLMSAASALAILLGGSAVYAQSATGTAGTGAQQEIRATVESKDEANNEIVLRLPAGEQVDFEQFEEGDEVYVSFEDGESVSRIGREPGMSGQTGTGTGTQQ